MSAVSTWRERAHVRVRVQCAERLWSSVSIPPPRHICGACFPRNAWQSDETDVSDRPCPPLAHKLCAKCAADTTHPVTTQIKRLRGSGPKRSEGVGPHRARNITCLRSEMGPMCMSALQTRQRDTGGLARAACPDAVSPRIRASLTLARFRMRGTNIGVLFHTCGPTLSAFPRRQERRQRPSARCGDEGTCGLQPWEGDHVLGRKGCHSHGCMWSRGHHVSSPAAATAAAVAADVASAVAAGAVCAGGCTMPREDTRQRARSSIIAACHCPP